MTTWTNQTKSLTFIDFLLMESGDFLLLEDDGKIVLEQSGTAALTWTNETKN